MISCHILLYLQKVSSIFKTPYVEGRIFFALSVGTRLDRGNTVAILPSGYTYTITFSLLPGTLILKLERDTYQQLGLTGTPIKKPHEKEAQFYCELTYPCLC